MRNTLDFEYALTLDGLKPNCRLRIDNQGRIQAIEEAPGGSYDGYFAVPGMPNAHSHAFQRALTGYGESPLGGESFWGWRNTMYRLANHIMPDDLLAIATRAYADMLLGGFTSVGEFHYLHHWPDGKPTFAMSEAVVEAAQSCGLRLVMLPVFYQRGGFGMPAQPEQRRFVHKDIADYLHLIQRLKRVATGIAPHSLRAVDPARLAELVQGARDILGDQCPVHIHIAEQRREVEDCVVRFSRTPIWLLADTVDLDEHWNFVHATHADAGELELMAQSKVNAILCLLTEAYLGDGIFPARLYLALSGQFGIGTDSNTRIDAVSELRWLEYGQRLLHEARAQLGDEKGVGEHLWSKAVAGGAAALAQPIGGIGPGNYADIVVLDTGASAVSGASPNTMLDAWMIGGDRSAIASVYVGGTKRVEQGELVVTPNRLKDFPQVVKRLLNG